MGCDIHFYVEAKKGGVWRTAGDDPAFYVRRNYDLFAVLAGVRNGRGFAGSRTGSGFVPVGPPRGVPDDASPETMKEFVLRLGFDDDRGHEHTAAQFDKWVAAGSSARVDASTVTNPDWHGASSLTARELRDYDWSRTTRKEGVVDAWNYELFRTSGKPDAWSSMVSGPAVEHVSNRRMADLIDSGELQWAGEAPGPGSHAGRGYTTPLQRSMAGWDLKAGSVGGELRRPANNYRTIVEWDESYASACGDFLGKTLPALLALDPDPDNARVVFWFDN